MPLRSKPVPMPEKKVTFKKSPGGAIYVYLTLRAYRNKYGKPTSDEAAIGKKDPVSGMLIPNRRYFELFHGKNNVAAERALPSSVASCGGTFALMQIARGSGLLAALKKCFPESWAQMLAVAMYMVCEGNVMMYIGDWFDEVHAPFALPMNDQQCGRLFAAITHGEREMFFREWIKFRSEQEYI